MLMPTDNWEQIKESIGAARLDEAELSSVVQPLYMSSQPHDDLFLMQMNSRLLTDIIEGQILTIRGEPNEPAVICTKSKTYDMKEAETSNSLLLSPNLLLPEGGDNGNITEKTVFPQKISGTFCTYYELKPSKPKLKKLKSLLEKCPYQGKEYEEEIGEKYTFDDLLYHVQASEEEIKSALLQMHACEIDGYVRLLDFNFKFQVFSSIRDVLDSESIPVDKIPKRLVIELLEDLTPREILDQFFLWYMSETSNYDEKGDVLYALKEAEVCKLYAEVLLRPAFRFNLRDFIESWQISVPEGMVTQSSHLKGLALSDLVAKPQVIFYFPVEDLPETVNERFNKLFETRPKWTFEDIEPYLKDLSSDNQDVKTLLTKHARSSVNNGIVMYSSRW